MTTQEIFNLVAAQTGETPRRIQYMAYGGSSQTYEVELPLRSVIVRTNTDPAAFAGTEHNISLLREIGLPVPTILAIDLTLQQFPAAYMMLEKIGGRDLGRELGSMSRIQMTHLAEQIVACQRKVTNLPEGRGYGYARIGGIGRFASWREMLGHDNRIQAPASEPTRQWTARAQTLLARYEHYFDAVRPVCFLDDITVKNVLVDHGVLQGLIDFDCVCYGDPLLWISLTATGVVSDVGEVELFYVDELCRLWGVTTEQKQILAVYSVMHALEFWARSSAVATDQWRNRMADSIGRWLAYGEG